MKTYSKNSRYPELRARFKTASEIGAVINRKECYVKVRMVEGLRDFTDLEKRCSG